MLNFQTISFPTNAKSHRYTKIVDTSKLKLQSLLYTPNVSKTNRALLWVLLIVLTVLLLLYPVDLSLEYHSVGSAHIFQNLPLFATVFFLWTTLILFLLFTTKHTDDHTNWEIFILICIFAVVFIGFWTFASPLGRGDMESNLAHINSIAEEGNIFSLTHWNLTGFDFPGIYFIVLWIAESTGLSILHAANLLLVFEGALLGVLLYILFGMRLRNPTFGGFAAMLAIMGNQIILGMYSFHATLALPMFIAFWIIFSRSDNFVLQPRANLLWVILLAATTITHFVTSALFLFALLGKYLVQRLNRNVSTAVLAIIICLVILLSWEAYYAIRTFDLISNMTSKIFEDLTSGEAFSALSMTQSANIGGDVPLWAIATRLFWWIFLYGLPVVLAVRWLIKRDNQLYIGAIEIGGLIGVIFLSITATFSAFHGHQFHRFFLYGSFFTSPILIAFILNKCIRFKAFLLPSLLFLSVISFPSFLIGGSNITVSAFHPYEDSAGQFLSKISNNSGNDLALYSPSLESGPKTAYYYVHNGAFANPPLFTEMKNEDGMWREINEVVDDYDTISIAYAENYYDRRPYYIDLIGLRLTYTHFFDVDTDALGWQNIELRLTKTNSKIYDSNYAQLYTLN